MKLCAATLLPMLAFAAATTPLDASLSSLEDRFNDYIARHRAGVFADAGTTSTADATSKSDVAPGGSSTTTSIRLDGREIDLSDPAVRAARFATFKENAAIVSRLNAENAEAEFSLDESPYALLSWEEFSSTRLPVMRGNSTAVFPRTPTIVSDFPPAPASFDWRDHGAVTGVKNQGALGSCWAFSSVGVIEGQIGIHHGKDKLQSLSVEQLIECDATTGTDSVDGKTHGDCGEFGGWPYLAYQYWQKAGGVLSDKDMGYCSGIDYGKPGNCMPCMPKSYSVSACGDHGDLYCHANTTIGQIPGGICSKKLALPTELPAADADAGPAAVARVKSWRRVSNSEKEMAADLAATGPVSVAIDATMGLMWYKKGVYVPKGIFKGCKSDGTALNHAVLVVGYGTDAKAKKDYWIVKNSWGGKWGEDGYFRIERGVKACGINAEVTVAAIE